MNNARISCLALALVVSFGMAVAGQERPRADNILRWFPYGYYSHIEHRDDTLMQQGEAWQLFKDFLDRPDPFSGAAALPPSLKDGIEARTTAQLLRLKQRMLNSSDLEDLFTEEDEPEEKNEEAGEEKEAGEKERPSSIPEGMTFTFMENVGDRLGVYRYELLDPQIEEALRASEIVDMGRRINERPIYRFSSRDESGDKGAFAYATAGGELLTAGRLRNLALMVAAGTGQEMNILDSEDYLDLIVLVPELGQQWRAICHRAMQKSMLEEMERKGGDQDTIEQRRESLERGSRLSINTTDVGEQITERDIEVYLDEETAKATLDISIRREIAIGNTPDEMKEHQQNVKAARKIEQVDNLVVTTIVYDRKLLESAKASNDALQKMIDQAQKEGGKKGQMIIVIDSKTEKK
ncbi:MAG TPA: hypothetical protein VMX35_13615 [Acidobacteriota bacterium]|nr:hypothetical protein [Acidobacteriota bacterium]